MSCKIAPYKLFKCPLLQEILPILQRVSEQYLQQEFFVFPLLRGLHKHTIRFMSFPFKITSRSRAQKLIYISLQKKGTYQLRLLGFWGVFSHFFWWEQAGRAITNTYHKSAHSQPQLTHYHHLFLIHTFLPIFPSLPPHSHARMPPSWLCSVAD